MTELMNHVDPEALENFTFVNYDKIDEEIEELRLQEKKNNKDKKSLLKNINRSYKVSQKDTKEAVRKMTTDPKKNIN